MFFFIRVFSGFRMLSKHSDTLTGKRKNLRIFLPLCGKAVDMKWLVDISINSST